MYVNVEQSKNEVGKVFPFHKDIPCQELAVYDEYPWSKDDLSVDGQYWYDGTFVHLQGTVGRTGIYQCTRCLAEVTLDETVSFHEIYKEHSAEEDAYLTYDGEEIDLTSLVGETLVLEEPTKILCNPNCEGLCHTCGANLNTSSCTCNDNKIDPRLAVLRTLLDDSES